MVVSFRVALCCGRLESLMYMSRLINLNLSVVGDLKDVCANCFFPFFITCHVMHDCACLVIK